MTLRNEQNIRGRRELSSWDNHRLAIAIKQCIVLTAASSRQLISGVAKHGTTVDRAASKGICEGLDVQNCMRTVRGSNSNLLKHIGEGLVSLDGNCLVG